MTIHPPDMTCVPYRRKRLYLVLTVPFLAVLVVTAVSLWTVSPWPSAGLALCYLGASLFQAYCCAYEECPYVGRFCPAIAGIVPASRLAKWIYGRRKVVKSKTRFQVHAAIGFLGLLGLALLPLWWLAQRSLLLAVGYFVGQVAYYLVFQLTICPACAIRDTCPGGALQRACRKRGQG